MHVNSLLLLLVIASNDIYYRRDNTIQGPESKQQRSSSHKSPGELSLSSTGTELAESQQCGDDTKATATQPGQPARAVDTNGSSVLQPPSGTSPPPPVVPSMEQFGILTAGGKAAPPKTRPTPTVPERPVQKLLEGQGGATTPVLSAVPHHLRRDKDAADADTDCDTTSSSRDRYPGGDSSPGRPIQRISVFARVDTPVEVPEERAEPEAGGEVEALGIEYDVETTQRTRSDSIARKSSYRPNAHLELMSMAASAVSGEKDGNVGGVTFQSSLAYTKRRSDSYIDGGGKVPQEELTEKAVAVIHRVVDKLTGLDFQDNLQTEENMATNRVIALPIPEQIDRLIKQATSNENLSTCFIGWCAFW